MKKPDSFPFEFQAAGLVFRVHLAPQSVKRKDGTTTHYESFLLQYYEGGQRVQRRRNSWEGVEQLIDDVVLAHRQKDPERLELSGRDRRLYLAAVDALGPLKLEVDKATQEFAAATTLLQRHGLGVLQAAQHLSAALEALEGAPLSEAISFFQRHKATRLIPGTVPEVLGKFLAEKRADGRGDYHLRDLENRLERFSETYGGPIQPITEAEISGWLQGLRKRDNRGVESDEKVGARTRNNYRDAIAELWEFARKRGYLPRDLETAAAGAERVKVVPGQNHIFTPAEMTRFLADLPAHLLVPAALKAFSGVRTEENKPLRWEHIRQESGALVVSADLAKLAQRRAPALMPNLTRWLKPFVGLMGEINPRYSTPQTLHQAFERHAKRAGLDLKRNTFRNSYISYRVAQPHPTALVAQETGTSVKMIESNYKELATAQEAKEWFSIVPTARQIKALQAYAAEIRANRSGKTSETPTSASKAGGKIGG